jgi:Asp-tRNA(Asn)/Glu-tRNA(Gln) amidotransferase A subunit family amidase
MSRRTVHELTAPLHVSSATALARAIRTKRLSSDAVIRKADARLLRRESLGPLRDVPLTTKTSLDTAVC